MARIGIYGGSFNPVHWGHVGLAEWVVAHTDLDEVWLMVSPNNPLKDPRILADEQVRLEQVQAAIAGKQGLVASDFEFHLPRPTYTAETLRALTKAYPEHTFTLIIGEDNLAIFDKWREYEYILANYRVFVYPRHGSHNAQCAMRNAQCVSVKMQWSNVQMLREAPFFDISSTEIRNNLQVRK